MQLELMFALLIPVILFVFAEVRYGLRAGVYAAVGSGILLIIYLYFRTGSLDEMILVEVGLLIVMGAVSLKMQSSRYLKLQPTVIAVIIGAYIFGVQVFDEPLMIRHLPMMEKLNPEAAAIFNTEAMRPILARMSWHAGILFLAHGALCAWAAYRKSSVVWLTVRLAIYPAMLVFIVAELAIR